MGYFNVGKSSNITYIDTAVNIGYAVKVELYGTWSKLAFVWKYNAWNDDIIFVFFISAQRRWLVFISFNNDNQQDLFWRDFIVTL